MAELILVIDPVPFEMGLPMLHDVELEPGLTLLDMTKLNYEFGAAALRG